MLTLLLPEAVFARSRNHRPVLTLFETMPVSGCAYLSNAIGLLADRTAKEIGAKGNECCPLPIVLAVAVPACAGLVEVSGIAQSLQLCGHLTRVARMDAVVPLRGGEQDRRIGLSRHRGVIGEDFVEESPIVRLVGIAIFVNPGCAKSLV